MTSDWRSYPFQLVPGDNQLEFPAAEGEHPDQESDTWFIAGQLDAAETDRSFAFLTIFNKNRPGGTVVADFYTMALFDLDTGDYGTFTDYDMPPANMEPGAQPKLTMASGHLDINYHSSAGTASWTTSRNGDGELLPYTYRVSLVGTGSVRSAHATRSGRNTNARTDTGGCIGVQRKDRLLRSKRHLLLFPDRHGDDRNPALGGRGTAGVRNQWARRSAVVPQVCRRRGIGGDPRARSHEWRTINFDNGVDLSIWRQFDRADGNALQPFTGVTTSHPDPAIAPECAEDIEVTVSSYVRWPEAVRPLVRPLAPARYMPDRHRITCPTLQLDLIGEPLVAAPAHGLPIEYMEGPYRYHGTMWGNPVTGFAFNERSLALYRDWELVDVLSTTVANLAPPEPGLQTMVDQVVPLVAAGRRQEAVELLFRSAPVENDTLAKLLDDLITVLSADVS